MSHAASSTSGNATGTDHGVCSSTGITTSADHDVSAAATEKRIADDGQAFYDNTAWTHTATEHDASEHDATTTATEHDATTTATRNGSTTATEHWLNDSTPLGTSEEPPQHNTQTLSLPDEEASPLVILDIQDIDSLLRAEAGRTPKRNLHKLARGALQTGIVLQPNYTRISLSTLFDWRPYVACHNEAQMIIGSGIVYASLEGIQGTSDPNRGGDPRVDFVFYRTDTTTCRVHPGTAKSNDAKLIISRSQPATSPATEQTTMRAPVGTQWASIPTTPFTWDDAATVPKGDQIGKKEAYTLLMNLAPQQLTTNSNGPFKWWLFVPNLGRDTRRVIGDGLTNAELVDVSHNTASITFTRCDNTTVTVEISAHGNRPHTVRVSY
jgi:hypothetical protein